MNPVRIENWSVTPGVESPWLAPEQVPIALQGEVYGHDKHSDGQHVVTAWVMQIKGRLVTTKSGTVYQLGEPDPKYAAWCVEQGKPINQDEPIKPYKEPIAS